MERSRLGARDTHDESRKKQVLATKAALLEERERLLSRGRSLQVAIKQSPWGSSILTYATWSIEQSFLSKRKSAESLIRIAQKLDSDTFYWDLMIWILVPGAYCEEILGDLNEEYLLKISECGEANARAWYQHQAVDTTVRYFWKRFERLAAIGALIDLMQRWFKR
jgi:hypothetical protein